MAQTIPEKLRSRYKGEQRVFALLKQLPDDVVVYFEPLIDNRHPDFVVIIPTLGVLLIEVKGWFLPDIVRADPNNILIRKDGREVAHLHPLRQVSDYKFLLMDRCAKDKQISDLINHSGRYAGKFQFPFASLAILSNISSDNLNQWPERSREIFPSKSVVLKDQLLAWEKLNPERLLATLRSYFDTFTLRKPMTLNQVNIVKAIIHPEVLIGLEFHNHIPSDEPTIKVLDSKQEELARDIGEGHRLVFGVAGSGKTVLLVARAKLIARLNEKAEVLVLCYNKTFAVYLSEALKYYPNIAVRNFHRWAASHLDWIDRESDSQLGERFHAKLKKGVCDSRRFDTILIDEAQDFDSTWYECVLEAIKDPKNSDLLIVGDASQGLYKRRKLSWKQLGIEAVGRTKYLEQNYRNTKSIIDLAARFACANNETNEDGLAAPLVDPSKCVRLAGTSAIMLARKDREDEVNRAVRVVTDLMRGKWFGESVPPLKPEQIGILYRVEQRELHLLRQALLKAEPAFPVIWLTERGKNAKGRICEPGVKILTIHSSKGLQFKAVIVLFANDCPATFGQSDDEVDERCLFYVALTRAEEHLAVSCSGPSKFMNEINVTTLNDGSI